MKRAALGIRMHSGWGVLVAVSGDANCLAVMDRRRIVITDSTLPGANQPYHHAADLELSKAEAYLANCAAISERLAQAAIEELVRQFDTLHHRIAGAAVLLASGRAPPSLVSILASHPLIHTAEGEFFRDAVRKACVGAKVPVTSIRERDLEGQAKATFGRAASRVQRIIAGLGKSIGPPWTVDHKAAALAAATILAG